MARWASWLQRIACRIRKRGGLAASPTTVSAVNSHYIICLMRKQLAVAVTSSVTSFDFSPSSSSAQIW